LLSDVDEGMKEGLSQIAACEEVGISLRTIQRWRLKPSTGDQRAGPLQQPSHSLTTAETDKILQLLASSEYRNLSPRQIVPMLADQGVYIASESSIYRLMHKHKLLTHRGKAKQKSTYHPRPLTATEPNQVYTWDITYLPAGVRGRYHYLYMFVDIFSRKITGWQVHNKECDELSSKLLKEICIREGIDRNQLALHSDNGGPMKGATMLVTMQSLGIMTSFSRPSVSNDNPFSEALFRTLKYCPFYPDSRFSTIEEAILWVDKFVTWYNEEHLHSAIKFIAPVDRHTGADGAILAERKALYEISKKNNPMRWTKKSRNWEKPNNVKLNCIKIE
jgi:putative transposase